MLHLGISYSQGDRWIIWPENCVTHWHFVFKMLKAPIPYPYLDPKNLLIHSHSYQDPFQLAQEKIYFWKIHLVQLIRTTNPYMELMLASGFQCESLTNEWTSSIPRSTITFEMQVGVQKNNQEANNSNRKKRKKEKRKD